MNETKKEEGFEILREGVEDVMRINYSGFPYPPSIEDNKICMLDVVNKLIQVPRINRVIFVQVKYYQYDNEQTNLLREIANLYTYLVKQRRILNPYSFGTNLVYASSRYNVMQYLIINLLRGDPLGCYVETKRLIRETTIALEVNKDPSFIRETKEYLEALKEIYTRLDNSELVKRVRDDLDGMIIGDRSLYSRLFRPVITPNFMLTRLMSQPPLDGEEVDAYSMDDSDILIFRIPGDVKLLYHLNPPEFKISEDKQDLLYLARTVLSEHKPEAEEFIDPARMRQNFFNIGRDLLSELAQRKNVDMDYDELNQLTDILVRYTVGFGLVEVLLKDEKVQDVTINGPIGQTPIFLIHQDYGECVTNIIPSMDEADSWATKFRSISGRSLDEANPILDTELSLPGFRSRVAVITRPLNPYGLGYAFRRHRDKPWTLPLFIKNGMIDPLGAGLLSFFVDGNRSILVAGTRSSGKTSFLGSLLIEIMRKYRIITVEDTLEINTEVMRQLGYNIQSMKVKAALGATGAEVSADEGIRTSLRMGDSSLIVGEIRSSIRGDEKVVIVEGGETKRIPIQDLEDRDIENIYVPTMDFDLKVKLSKLTGFVKHPKRNKLLKVRTRTGREVTVTPDHSLFTSHNFKIFPIECMNLKIGSKIVLPSKLPCGYNDINYLNLLDIIDDARVKNFEEPVRKIISKIGWKEATSLCGIKTGDIYNYYRRNQKTNIPISSFNKLMMFADETLNLENVYIKNGTSNILPALLPVNEDFCRFLGYFISEGYFIETSVVISNNNKNIISDVVSIIRTIFNADPSIRETKGLGISKQICITNSPLVKLLKKLNCGRTSKEKRIPSFIFGLSESKIYAFLSGLYAGDGNFTSSKSSGNCIRYYTTSKELADDLMYLLLHVGIVSEIRRRNNYGLGDRPIYIIEFKDRSYVNKFLDNVNFIKYIPKVVGRGVAHSSLNTVTYDIKELEKRLKLIRKYRHLRKYNSCGKNFLKKLVFDVRADADKSMKIFANGEFYLDDVKEIEELNLDCGEYVYDLSVEPSQNFIGGFGGILLHNTEAKSLYEAMRIGSLANVVAGTIHGDSPYGVFDRVVNDLNVPRTSFKATDIIVVANPVKSADGLSSKRRIISITEVRKDWEEDPLKEGGFVDLMKYNAKTDLLEPTDALINGDSEVIKAVASQVRDWVGDWEAVWSNILLRAELKKRLIEASEEMKLPNLLEADFVVKSNDAFHRILNEVREDLGSIDNKRVRFEWEEWLKREIKKNG